MPVPTGKKVRHQDRASETTAANESSSAAVDFQVSFPVVAANQYAAADGKANWVQLFPFGKVPYTDRKTGNTIVQCFNPDDSKAVVNEFNSPLSIGVRMLGIPFYVGHPDHPSFKGDYPDKSAKGRIKQLETRCDAGCARCSDFANQRGESPCPDHGLFGSVKWNEDGRRIIANEEFHGHSVNWPMHKGDDGCWHPHSLRSVGFTNQPNVNMAPITAANEKVMTMSEAANSAADGQTGGKKGPTLLTYISGLLKKPDLAKEGANADDAVAPMQEYANAAEQTAKDLAAEREAHGVTKSKHAAMATMCNAVMKAYGANERGELPEPVVKRAGKPLTADNVVEFAANEISTRETALAKSEQELTAANEKVVTLTTDVANARQTADKNILDLLVVGGFVTAAERKAYEPKLAANETRDATRAELLALKPKINVVSQVGNLGHASTAVADAANEKFKSYNRTQAIVDAVNELQAKHLDETGKRLAYPQAFAKVQRDRKDLFADTENEIVR